MKQDRDSHRNDSEQGFQFPGVFELSAIGMAGAGLEIVLPDLLEAGGIPVVRESVTVRASSAGRYVSVRIGFRAESRAEYEAAFALVRAHPGVRWTI